MNKKHCNYTTEYYLAIKRNQLQMHLHSVKEANHQRSHITGSHLYELSGKGQFIGRESRLVAAWGCGEIGD